MTQETAKKYTLTAHDIQAYLCELDIKPTEEVSIYSIEYYFDKLPVTTDKISVEKLEPIGYYNESHGFLHDESDKDCYCQGGCYMEAVYTESQVKKLTDENTVEKLQEQLNAAKKALINIKWRTERDELETYYVERNHDIRKDAIDALAVLEGGEDE